jgi:hypothetical protein
MVNSARLLVLACLFALTLGCGGGSTEPAAPSGSELTDYLAEHPEINAETEPDDESDE